MLEKYIVTFFKEFYESNHKGPLTLCFESYYEAYMYALNIVIINNQDNSVVNTLKEEYNSKIGKLELEPSEIKFSEKEFNDRDYYCIDRGRIIIYDKYTNTTATINRLTITRFEPKKID